jgi:hypothetical protein
MFWPEFQVILLFRTCLVVVAEGGLDRVVLDEVR